MYETHRSDEIRSYDVYKQAGKEFRNEYLIDGDWDRQLSTMIATFKIATGTKLPGYIQNFEKDNGLEIALYSEKQFECIKMTPYKDSILHIDATGGLVKLNINSRNEFNDYSRIYNYTYLLRNTQVEKPDDKIEIGKN